MDLCAAATAGAGARQRSRSRREEQRREMHREEEQMSDAELDSAWALAGSADEGLPKDPSSDGSDGSDDAQEEGDAGAKIGAAGDSVQTNAGDGATSSKDPEQDSVFWHSGLELAGNYGVRLSRSALLHGVMIKTASSRSAREKEIAVLTGGIAHRSSFVVKLECILSIQEQADGPEETFLALEYCPFGDLVSVWKSRGLFTVAQSLLMAAEMALALGALHQLGIIHGDVKPENICFDRTRHAKLVDFGLAEFVSVPAPRGRRPRGHGVGPPHSVVTSSGTLNYAAPEILRRLAHRFESDWWSLGVVLFESITGRVPWEQDIEEAAGDLEAANGHRAQRGNADTPESLQAVCDRICLQPITFPTGLEDELPTEILSLLAGLLNKTQASRLGSSGFAADIREHPAWQASMPEGETWDWDVVAQRLRPVLDPVQGDDDNDMQANDSEEEKQASSIA